MLVQIFMKSPVPKKRMRSEIWAPSMNDPPTVIGASPALANRLLAAVGKPTADHKRVFSDAASRRGDRIRASWIAALLSAMIVLTAVHPSTHSFAENAIEFAILRVTRPITATVS